MSSLRRTPDGRYYADIRINGVRQRVSLHTRDAAVAADRYDKLTCNSDAMPPPQRATESLADWYCDIVMTARGNTEGTRESTRAILTRWLDWLAEHKADMQSLRHDTSLIDRYVTHLRQTRAASTVRKELRKIRALQNALWKKRPNEYRRFEVEWPRIRIADRPRDFLTADEHRGMLNAAAHAGAYRGPAVMLLSYGCRPVDVASLTWDAVDIARRQIVICQRKTGDAVPAPIVTDLYDLLLKARLATGGRGTVWRLANGQPHYANGIGMWWRRWSLRAIGRMTSPKICRQTVVTRLRDAGAAQDEIGILTGHRSDAVEAYLGRRQERAAELLAIIRRG